ncbi:MAG: hypothetical protein JWQ18_36 [Conexibacter sp.]|nr:hypothetical protein [Conexibacter sp.]
MSRSGRIVLLVTALLSLLAVMSSAAGAVTWHNSGDTAFTATSGALTFSVTGPTFTCPGTTATATVASSPFVGATWTAITGTETYNSCAMGGVGARLDCSFTFTAQLWTAGPPATTTGSLDETCGLFEFSSMICRLAGAFHAVYANPSPPSTFGRFTLTTGGSLVTSNASSGTCPLGTGDRAHFTERTLVVNSATGGPTPHLGPIITRTS